MKTKLLFTTVILFCLGFASVQAQVSERAHDEHERFAHGMRNGEITPREAHRLAREQKHIRRDIRRARCNDGYLSKRERRHIAREQNYANRQIFRAKHNGTYRF